LVLRFDRHGSLDAGFGTGGIVRTDATGGQDLASGVMVQRNGKIVVAGWADGSAKLVGGADVVLARYNRNGSLDGTFGTDGIAQADFSTPDEFTSDALTSLAIQRDGQIVAAGFTFHFFTTGDTDFALLRFDANPSPRPR
jgi:uncharacterized delta-60 repeat protein